jgi:murein DD-endopeptidase MepM/ murein hydrolase activator NlpD
VFFADSDDWSVSLRAEFAQRLMKARKGLAAFTIMCAAAALGLGFAWNVGLFGAGAAATAAANAAIREEAALRAEHLAFTEPYLAHETREVRVANGETLASLITRAGGSPAEASAATSSIGSVYDPRRLRPGQSISLFFSRRAGQAQLTGIAFRSAPGASVTANRTTAGFAAREVLMPVSFEIARIAAAVETSLYASALSHGATDREIAALADAFSYDVDFQRDVRPGDEFELVFERFYDDEGNTVRTGELLFVGLESRRGERAFYQFLAPGDNRPDWYDADGKSARKFLMRTPINGARLSSGFGMRRHPILGYSRMHRGTDFAAPSGTPILAAGEGTVVRMGRYGAYGNYVRIRHSNGYETAYAHMSRYARGMRSGAQVRQGQVIGYVGTTGRSTGPHLHYEVMRRGSQINPVNLRVADGRNLEGRALELFQIERQRIDTLRTVRSRETPAQQAVLRAVDGGATSAGAP